MIKLSKLFMSNKELKKYSKKINDLKVEVYSNLFNSRIVVYYKDKVKDELYLTDITEIYENGDGIIIKGVNVPNRNYYDLEFFYPYTIENIIIKVDNEGNIEEHSEIN